MIRPIKQQLNQQSTSKSLETEGDLNYSSVEEQSVSSLTDTDYEFLFNELLEGVAHGWHSVKIAKFFERLGERGQQKLWVAWLERYQTKILKGSDLYQQQLGARMIRLGELSQSIYSTKEIGSTAYQIGQKIIYGSNPNLIWEYNGADLPLASEEATIEETEDHQGVAQNDVLTRGENTTSSPSSSFAEAANWIQEAIAEFVELAETASDKSVVPESEKENNSEEQSSSETAELSQPLTQPTGELFTSETTELSQLSTQPTGELSVVPSAEKQEEQNLVKNEANLVKATNIKPSLLENENIINLSWEQFVEIIEEDNHLVTQIAKHYNLTNKDPKSIIEAVTTQLNRLESESSDQSTVKLVESWFNLGLKQASSGDLNEAVISWEKALELNPNLAEAWHNRGSALGRLGNYQEALESFDQALKIAPDNAQAWNERAHTLYQLRQWQEAVESWEQAIAIVSSNYQFWYNRGCALEQLEEYQEAIASYKQALEIKPDFQLAKSRYTSLLANTNLRN